MGLNRRGIKPRLFFLSSAFAFRFRFRFRRHRGLFHRVFHRDNRQGFEDGCPDDLVIRLPHRASDGRFGYR